MTVTPLGRDQDCSLKIRDPDVPAPWFLDPGGWSNTTAVGLYFIFPGICTLSLEDLAKCAKPYLDSIRQVSEHEPDLKPHQRTPAKWSEILTSIINLEKVRQNCLNTNRHNNNNKKKKNINFSPKTSDLYSHKFLVQHWWQVWLSTCEEDFKFHRKEVWVSKECKIEISNKCPLEYQ
ncbi:hypothetical protein STEG23_029016 [Scotinomys teguina]